MSVTQSRALGPLVTACPPDELHIGCDLDDSTMIDREVDGTRDEAFLMRDVMERLSAFPVRSRRQGNAWVKRNLDELSCAAGFFLHHRAFRCILIGQDDNAGGRAKSQIPKMMTGGERRQEKIFRVPSASIAAE